MNDVDKLIDINKKKGLPRKYKFNQFVRWFTLILASAAIAYSIWMVVNKIDAESSTFHKIAPFVIMFLALNSVLKNLFTMNVIVFSEDGISFHYLGKRKVLLQWKDLQKMEFSNDKHRQIILKYSLNGEENAFSFSISFPNMLEIVNSIAEMCPDLQYDDFMTKVVISSEEREKFNKQRKEQQDETQS